MDADFAVPASDAAPAVTRDVGAVAHVAPDSPAEPAKLASPDRLAKRGVASGDGCGSGRS